jgi:hypothetical protein
MSKKCTIIYRMCGKILFRLLSFSNFHESKRIVYTIVIEFGVALRAWWTVGGGAVKFWRGLWEDIILSTRNQSSKRESFIIFWVSESVR